MKKKYTLIILIGLITSSCLSPSDNSTIATQTSTEINIAITSSAETSSPKSSPTATRIPSFARNCVTIQDRVPDNVFLEGVLVLNSKLLDTFGETGEVSLTNMENLEILPIPDSEINIGAIPSKSNISPDRKRFFYFSADKQLFIKSTDGYKYPAVSWDTSWGEAAEWFDNERLIVRPEDAWRDGVLIIINPLTGEWMKIQNKFPSGLNPLFPFVDYNLVLDRGIYVSGDYLILWNAQSSFDIWKEISFSKEFRWNPNRDKVALTVSQGDFTNNLNNELVVVDQEGQEILITNFVEAYPLAQRIEIRNISWSPDGRYLAFALNVGREDMEIETPTLIVVDLESALITDYCLVVPEYSPIIWSPNSRNIIITTPLDYEEYKKTISLSVVQKGDAILVNFSENYAMRILNNTVVDGWMLLK